MGGVGKDDLSFGVDLVLVRTSLAARPTTLLTVAVSGPLADSLDEHHLCQCQISAHHQSKLTLQPRKAELCW